MGSGGREHALARLLARSSDVVVTPGNPGMPAEASGHSISVTPAPPEEIGARLTVIGPEAPLVDGLADRLRARGHLVVGPGRDGAALEGSGVHASGMWPSPASSPDVGSNPIQPAPGRYTSVHACRSVKSAVGPAGPSSGFTSATS